MIAVRVSAPGRFQQPGAGYLASVLVIYAGSDGLIELLDAGMQFGGPFVA
jgi:hypothetical protein